MDVEDPNTCWAAMTKRAPSAAPAATKASLFEDSEGMIPGQRKEEIMEKYTRRRQV
jgi:hypothetical protein